MYEYHRLNAFTSDRFWEFTFPKWRRALVGIDRGGTGVGIGAMVEQVPVGLALAEVLDGDEAHLLSISVREEHRGLGIATRLLTTLEEALPAHGVHTLSGTWTSEAESTAAVEALLRRRGWREPVPRLRIYKASVQVMEADWLGRWELPPSLSIERWCQLDEARLAATRARVESRTWCGDELSPFENNYPLDPLNSLALLDRTGSVMGWVITQRVDQETIRYGNVFVDASLRRSGAVIPVIAESIRIHLEERESIPIAIWAVDLSNRAMLSLVERRLAPHAMSIRETRGSVKELV